MVRSRISAAWSTESPSGEPAIPRKANHENPLVLTVAHHMGRTFKGLLAADGSPRWYLVQAALTAVGKPFTPMRG